MNDIILDLDKISCAICLNDDFNEEDTYKTECNHIFCKKCLDDWFSRGNNCCPLCRTEINEYMDNDNHYKLVIYEREIVSTPGDIQVIRSLLLQNLRLRVYMGISFVIFLVYLYQYYSVLNDYDNLSQNYKLCSNNNTLLETQLRTLQTNYNSHGTTVAVYDGFVRVNCFHPDKYFGCNQK